MMPITDRHRANEICSEFGDSLSSHATLLRTLTLKLQATTTTKQVMSANTRHPVKTSIRRLNAWWNLQVIIIACNVHEEGRHHHVRVHHMNNTIDRTKKPP